MRELEIEKISEKRYLFMMNKQYTNNHADLTDLGEIFVMDQIAVSSKDQKEFFEKAVEFAKEKKKVGILFKNWKLQGYHYYFHDSNFYLLFFQKRYGINAEYSSFILTGDKDPILEEREKYDLGIEKIKELHPTNVLNTPFIDNDNFHYAAFYCMGEKGFLKLTFEEGKYQLINEKHHIVAIHPESNEAIIEFFKIAYKRFRLTSLYRESVYHFNEIYIQNDLELMKPHMNRNLIRKALLEKHTNDEIETYFAINKMESWRQIQTVHELTLFNIMEYYIITDLKNNRYAIEENKELSYTIYEKWVFENTHEILQTAKNDM